MVNSTPTRSRQPLPASDAKPVPVVRLPPAIKPVPVVGLPPQAQMPTAKPKPESPTPPQTFKKREIQLEPIEMEQQPSDATSFLMVHDNLIRCSVADLKNIAYSVVKDDKYELIEKAFNCHFRISQRGKNSELRMNAFPVKGGAYGLSSKFLQQWATKVLEGEPVEMSSYWMDFCRKLNTLSRLSQFKWKIMPAAAAHPTTSPFLPSY
jgi:hypothetical protein